VNVCVWKKKRFDSLKSLKPEFDIYWLPVGITTYIEHTNYEVSKSYCYKWYIFFYPPTNLSILC